MKYRMAQQSDFDGMVELAKKNNMKIPEGGSFFVAEDDGKIVGFIGVQTIGRIEPVVSDNPVAGISLYHMAVGALAGNGLNTYIATTTKESGAMLEKMGAEKVDGVMIGRL